MGAFQGLLHSLGPNPWCCQINQTTRNCHLPPLAWVRSTVSVVPLESLDSEGSLSSSVGYILFIDLGVISGVWSMLVSLKVTLSPGLCWARQSSPSWSSLSGGMTHLLLFLCHPLLLEHLWLLECWQLKDICSFVVNCMRWTDGGTQGVL